MVCVLRRLRKATSPGWLALHLLTVALVVTMVLLGRWQLDVSDSKHFNLQNFGYALQWWAFSAFTLVLWFRLVRDGGLIREGDMGGGGEPADPSSPEATGATSASSAGTEPEPVQYRRYVMPNPAEATRSDDPTLGAYNDYLARLAAEDERNAEGTAR